MVQTFQAVRCFSCKTFQVSLVKKTPKWSCKICNEKQSLKQIFYQGKSADCRAAVQQLNRKAGEEAITTQDKILLQADREEENHENHESVEDPLHIDTARCLSATQKKSKWTDFMNETSPLSSEDDDDSNVIWGTDMTKENQPNKQSSNHKQRNAHKEKQNQKKRASCDLNIDTLKPNKISKWNNYMEANYDND